MQCLNTEDNRPSAKDLLESKFLNEVDSEKDNLEVQVQIDNDEKSTGHFLLSAGGLGSANKAAIGLQAAKYRKRQGSTIIEEEEENNSRGDSHSHSPEPSDSNNEEPPSHLLDD